MADQSIACPSCGKKIPLTRALRDEIEASLKDEFSRQLEDAREQARADAARTLDDARRLELTVRKREQVLERQQADLEVTVARAVADERAKLVTEIEERAAERHRLKDTEKDR